MAEYNKMDWVKLSNSLKAGEDIRITPYLGSVIRIHDISGSYFNFRDLVTQDLRGSFKTSSIQRKATEKEIAGIDKVIEQKKKERVALIEKEKEGVVYKPSDVGKIAVDVFGEERVMADDEKRELIIWFPSINITNSKGEEHIIKDLYIKFNIEPLITRENWELGSYKANVDITGNRGAISLKEYESSYGHSHMNSGNYMWAGFCMGTSDYGLLFQTLQLTMLEEDWELVFLGLENYLKWESLEGGPYKRIGEMKYEKRINGDAVRQELNRIIADMPKDVWDVGEGGLSLINDHPSLKEYFNSTSKIRDRNSYSKEEAMAAAKRGEENLKDLRKRQNGEIMWGKEKKEIEIYYEEPENNSEKPISKNILEEYYTILAQKGKQFIKKYTYGRAKRHNREKVFGQSGTQQ